MSAEQRVAIGNVKDIALPRYDEMCTAIAACHRVDEAKNLHDKADGLRAYYKQANNREAETQFAEIKIRAERKCGELLRDMAERGERDKGRPEKESHRATLSDLGIDKSESARFQQVADVPERKFEAALAKARKAQQPITAASIRSLTRQPDFTPAQRASHERLWRVLRALEQISEQDVSPKEWIAELPDYMVDRVSTHLKRARPWLERFFTEWERQHGQ